MTTPATDTPTRKLLDVAKIIAILDAEKHLIHGALVEPIGGESQVYCDWISSADLPQPGPLALAQCEHAGRCAMGSLLFATGKISPRTLDGLSGDPGEWGLDTVQLLYAEYGMQRQHAIRIVDSNDSHTVCDDIATIATRRERVKAAVERLARRQREFPDRDLAECRETESNATVAPLDAIAAFRALDLGDWDEWTGGDWVG